MSDIHTEDGCDSDDTDVSPEELAARVAHRLALEPLPKLTMPIGREPRNRMIRAKKAWKVAKVRAAMRSTTEFPHANDRCA
jgi:hypothetical protein